MSRIYISSWIVIFSTCIITHAQQKVFLAEDFKDPSTNWITGQQKKVSIGSTVGEAGYRIKNEETKSDAIILLKNGFDNTRSYRIESTLERIVGSEPGDTRVGLWLAGKDDKNGYAFMINGHNNLALYRVKSGKWESLIAFPFNKDTEWYQKDLGEPGKSVKLKVLLTPNKWHLFVDEKLIFDINSYPIGNKAGLIVSRQTACRVLDFRVYEGNDKDIVTVDQPLNRDQYIGLMNQIYCAAAKNFEPLVGERSAYYSAIMGRDAWEMKVLGEPIRVKEKYVMAEENNNGWQKRALFEVYTKSREEAEIIYEQYRNWFYTFNSNCLRENSMQSKPEINLTTNVIRLTLWEGYFDSERGGSNKKIFCMLVLMNGNIKDQYIIMPVVYYTW